jgi:hypothetical protein
MTHIHWVVRQNKREIPRDKDEVNKREIHECDGRTHDPDTMVVPLTQKPTSEVEVIVRDSSFMRRVSVLCVDLGVCGEFVYVYYESRKGDLKISPIYECRCDERLKLKTDKSTRLSLLFFLFIMNRESEN